MKHTATAVAMGEVPTTSQLSYRTCENLRDPSGRGWRPGHLNLMASYAPGNT